MQLMQQVVETLSGKRFPLEDEKRTQYEIHDRLCRCFARVEREVRISGGVIDFVVWPGPGGLGVGIEVKVKGNPAEIRRQLGRYAFEQSLGGLVLVTSRAVPLPAAVRGKPVSTVDLARAWL